MSFDGRQYSVTSGSFGASKLRQCLRFPRLDKVKQQLHSQLLLLHRAHPPTLAAPTSGNGEDLSGDPVGALVGLALMLAGDRVAERRCSVHGTIMDDSGRAGLSKD